MTNFKFGDRVRIRDIATYDWQYGVYIRYREVGCFMHYALVEGKPYASHYKYCELVEAAPEALTPRFKVGDVVTFPSCPSTTKVTGVTVVYDTSDGGRWRGQDLQLAPKEIKVGSEVRRKSSKAYKGRVLVTYIEPYDNTNNAVVTWDGFTLSTVERVDNLEVL